jgi:tungstate transport system ATP-binding protein
MTAPALWALSGLAVQLQRNATDSYALTGLNLRIHAGERVALVGSNGCGKSTLLRVLNGLLPITAGSYEKAPGFKQSLLAQTPHLLRTSVRNNVALAAWLRGTSWRDAKTLADAQLSQLALSHLTSRSAMQLSVGQLQRVALCQCLVTKPDVLLLDEPTASLDPHAKRDVETVVSDYVDSQPTALGLPRTLVFSSHNLGQVKRLATRVIYMEGGQVLVDLPAADFFDETVMAHQAPSANLFLKGEKL